MGRGRKTNFRQSLGKKMMGWNLYMRRLCELSMSMFEWKGLPETADARYLELALFLNGSALAFKDDVIGFITLDNLSNGSFAIYGEPVSRRAFSRYTSYNSPILNKDNSVIIWNNYLRIPSVQDALWYANRLWELDSTIDVNAKAQKTPVLIQCDEKQKLVLENVYKEYDGNSPVIFGDKNLDIRGFGVLKTDAPYVSDKLYELKNQIWNEALTYLGIANVNYQKKERLISDEVLRSQGGTIASRFSRLTMRQQACDKINKMFGLDVSVEYREDFNEELLGVPNNPFDANGGVDGE